jgi:Mycothiol maleylpyruvate isomerase N-terminal domain
MALPAPADVAAALDAAYTGITRTVSPLDGTDLLLPSGCRGWTNADLLLHLTLDAQRALVALATPADGPADVDHVTYWREYPGTGDPDAAADHAQWVRRTASAFHRPSGVVRLWCDTAPAAARAACRADPAGRVGTQGHVLAVPDFLATLVTEAVIHHLDLIVSLPDAPGPAPEAVGVALATLAGLAAPGGLPVHWDDREALLKGTGRVELGDADRRALGDRAALFPLFR